MYVKPIFALYFKCIYVHGTITPSSICICTNNKYIGKVGKLYRNNQDVIYYCIKVFMYDSYYVCMCYIDVEMCFLFASGGIIVTKKI